MPFWTELDRFIEALVQHQAVDIVDNAVTIFRRKIANDLLHSKALNEQYLWCNQGLVVLLKRDVRISSEKELTILVAKG